jgi:hypothetical protein
VEVLGELLEEERLEGKSVFVVSRFPGLAGLGEHRVVMLEGGRIAIDSAEEDVQQSYLTGTT